MAEVCRENPLQSTRIDEAIGCRSVIERITQIINTMPERQKAVFRLSRDKGLSSKEIAAKIGITTGSVDNYISGALKIIRQELAKDELI